jgi:hypothetical protein
MHIYIRNRLDERTHEFERLRGLHKNDLDENIALKTRLEDLKRINELERKELEYQMKNIIHSQAGKFAKESERFSSLQAALQDQVIQLHSCVSEQNHEISWLKRSDIFSIHTLSFNV